MSSSDCLRYESVSAEISGTSKISKEDAVNAAFRDLKEKVSSKVKGIIIYMKPSKVLVMNIQCNAYEDRFLLLFMPRKRETVKVTLQVDVEVGLIEI